MNPRWGWGLAALAVAVGFWGYGWPGVALAFSVIVFWLLLQFSRSLRVMKDAGSAPIGRVPSAVMLHARLKRGLTLLQVVAMTRSLGREVAKSPETWAWGDDSGAVAELVFEGARLERWVLRRPPESAAE